MCDKIVAMPPTNLWSIWLYVLYTKTRLSPHLPPICGLYVFMYSTQRQDYHHASHQSVAYRALCILHRDKIITTSPTNLWSIGLYVFYTETRLSPRLPPIGGLYVFMYCTQIQDYHHTSHQSVVYMALCIVHRDNIITMPRTNLWSIGLYVLYTETRLSPRLPPICGLYGFMYCTQRQYCRHASYQSVVYRAVCILHRDRTVTTPSTNRWPIWRYVFYTETGLSPCLPPICGLYGFMYCTQRQYCRHASHQSVVYRALCILHRDRTVTTPPTNRWSIWLYVLYTQTGLSPCLPPICGL